MSRFLAWILVLPAIAVAQDAREIVRRACDLDRNKNIEAARNYTYIERKVEVDLDGSGKPKRREVTTWDVTQQEGSPYRRLLSRNDQPISAAEQKQEEEKLQRSIEQRRKETPEQRERRIADYHRRQEKQREPVKELPDAFDFKLVGEEALGGSPAWVIDATPKPGYKPKSSAASIFPKVKARLWIDKADYQWAKVDMETLDTISFGGILVRIGKGGHMVLEQTRVNNEVWLPKHVDLTATARVLLVKGLRKSLQMDFSNYRKFQADSRIVSTAEK